jgi:hypothetical protein
MSHEEIGEQAARATAAQARASFERAVDALDVGTVNRLRLFRREALATRPRRPGGWLLPVGAMAATVLAGVLLWRSPGNAVTPPSAPIVVEDVAPLEFPSEEEAELYAWLGEAPVATPQGSAL